MRASSPDPLSQLEVEGRIAALCRDLNQVTIDLHDAAQAAAQARYEYRVAHARAVIHASGTVAEREAKATLEVSDLLQRRELAEAVERSKSEAGRNVRAQLEGMRSLLVGMRAAVSHASGIGA